MSCLNSIPPPTAAVLAAARHEFPTGDIDSMLDEIERGYGSAS